MSWIEIILLGVGLAMDCFAVSLSRAVAARRVPVPRALLMALLFGLFQAGMPLIGYFAGSRFVDFISRIAPYLALGLLGFIGGKMIWEYFAERREAAREDDAEAASGTADYSLATLLVLSVATSIDALASGLIFVDKPQILWQAIAVIGICSTLFSLAGTLIGIYAGRRFNFPAELIGGLILIGIGIKIFLG